MGLVYRAIHVHKDLLYYNGFCMKTHQIKQGWHYQETQSAKILHYFNITQM